LKGGNFVETKTHRHCRVDQRHRVCPKFSTSDPWLRLALSDICSTQCLAAEHRTRDQERAG